MSVRAKFFKDGERDLVEIKIAGQEDTVIEKVNPQHLADYPREWEAYQRNEKDVDYGGTPLTEVPGMSEQAAVGYKLKGIHNAEMLAEASDGVISRLGMGALAFRKSAQNLVDANKHRKAAPAPKATADDRQADKVAKQDEKRLEGDNEGIKLADEQAKDVAQKQHDEQMAAARRGEVDTNVTTESLQNQRATAAIAGAVTAGDKRK